MMLRWSLFYIAFATSPHPWHGQDHAVYLIGQYRTGKQCYAERQGYIEAVKRVDPKSRDLLICQKQLKP